MPEIVKNLNNRRATYTTTNTGEEMAGHQIGRQISDLESSWVRTKIEDEADFPVKGSAEETRQRPPQWHSDYRKVGSNKSGESELLLAYCDKLDRTEKITQCNNLPACLLAPHEQNIRFARARGLGRSGTNRDPKLSHLTKTTSAALLHGDYNTTHLEFFDALDAMRNGARTTLPEQLPCGEWD